MKGDVVAAVVRLACALCVVFLMFKAAYDHDTAFTVAWAAIFLAYVIEGPRP